MGHTLEDPRLGLTQLLVVGTGRAHLGRVMSGLAELSGCQPRTVRIALTCLCGIASGEAERASVA